MKVTVLLADSAQSDATSKTHALGLGWTTVDAPTSQSFAVLVLVSFDDRQDVDTVEQTMVLRLVTDDGTPFELPNEGEPLALVATLDFESANAEVPGGPVTAPFIVTVAPGLPLQPSQRYRWVAEVGGRAGQSGEAVFVTRPSD